MESAILKPLAIHIGQVKYAIGKERDVAFA